MKYSHLYLKNSIGKNNTINTVRGFGGNQEEDNDVEVINPNKYILQKARLRENWNQFSTDKEFRHSNRTLELPVHLDYILIDFFNDFAFSSKTEYFKKFGLEVVHLSKFNQRVLFYICNEEKFQNYFYFLLKKF